MRMFWFAAAGLLVVVALGFVVQRLAFLAGAEHTVGTVSHVDARDGRCGGGRRRASYACTKFQATVEFQVGTRTQRLSLDGGHVRGSGQSVLNADYTFGQKVNVVHAPDGDPAYEDSASGVWGTPALTFLFALGAGFGGWRQKEQ